MSPSRRDFLKLLGLAGLASAPISAVGASQENFAALFEDVTENEPEFYFATQEIPAVAEEEEFAQWFLASSHSTFEERSAPRTRLRFRSSYDDTLDIAIDGFFENDYLYRGCFHIVLEDAREATGSCRLLLVKNNGEGIPLEGVHEWSYCPAPPEFINCWPAQSHYRMRKSAKVTAR
jgi:hypothetical protein